MRPEDSAVGGTGRGSEEESRAASPLLGRHQELGVLLAGLADASAGRGRLILIGGEPGIGKSRLADEAAALGRAQGAMVLWGKCWEAGGAPAYWPWVQCLRTYVRAHDPDTLRDQMGAGAGDIVQMLPELETLISDLPPPPSLDPESARFRLFDSTAAFLRAAGNAETLVLVIDDLHAADTASLLFLRFIASQIAEMRILVLATYRDVELTPDHPLKSSITDLVREPATHHLMLGGLRRSDVALLVERTAAVAPPSSLVSMLHRQTNGNPLFVSEAIRMLATEGGLSESVEGATLRFVVPEAVRDVILRRVEQLSDPCRRTLTLASVLGPEIPIEPLRRLGNLNAERFAGVIDEAATSGLLVEVAGILGRFRFSHDLVREVLYEEITPGQRARLHLRAGQVLEQFYAADLDSNLGMIAHHYFEGAPAGNAAKATEYARRAAEHAARQLAYEETARLYGMALQAMELDDSTETAVRCDLLLGLGDAQMRSGDRPAAQETFLGAAGIARRHGMSDHLARAALGYGGRFVWARAGNNRDVIPLLIDALEAVGEDDTLLRARLLARLAGASRDQPNIGPRDAHSQEAVDVARRLGDPATLAYALDGRYSAIWAPDTADERLQIADEMVRIAEAIGDDERAFQGHHYRLAVFMEQGAIEAVRAELEVNKRLAERLRQPAQYWYIRATEAILALLEGRFEDAEHLIGEAFEYGRQAENMHALGVVLVQKYALQRERGRASEAEDEFRESLDEYSFWPWLRCVLLHLYTEVDRKTEARSMFEAIAAQDFQDLPWDNDWLMGMSLLAEVVSRLREKDRASALYDLLRPYSDRNGFGHPEFCTGSIQRSLGLLAVLMGQPERAELHFEDAIVANEGMGALPWAAQSRHDLADLLLSRDAPGDKERAEGVLRQALTTAADLGMVVLEGKVRRLLGDTPVSAGVPSDPVLDGVFRREGEYWSIAFEGKAVRLRDSKGLRHLERLLAAPGREYHVLDLVRMEEGLPESAVTVEHGVQAGDLGDAGEVLDSKAKAAYRQRLEDLREEIEEAEGWNDTERASRAKEEMEFLSDQLAGAVGLGGRDRKVASAAERARLNVSRAIRAAMGRIAENHPTLGEHLDATITTGLFCSYTPDPRIPITWRL